MKKLMILAAVAFAAVASQASVFKWTASGVKDIAGTADYSGALTLYYAASGSATFAEYGTYAMTDGAFTINDAVCSKLTPGTAYQFYYTMDNGKGGLFTSGTKTGMANTGAATRNIAFNATGSWATEPEPTPEPTSAMLMLLGVAGLALRRKQK